MEDSKKQGFFYRIKESIKKITIKLLILIQIVISIPSAFYYLNYGYKWNYLFGAIFHALLLYVTLLWYRNNTFMMNLICYMRKHMLISVPIILICTIIGQYPSSPVHQADIEVAAQAGEKARQMEAYAQAVREEQRKKEIESKSIKGKIKNAFASTMSKTDGFMEKHAIISDTKSSIKASLKDPVSAEFRNVKYYNHPSGINIVCGEVNAKNSLGGYVGFRPFISKGSEIEFSDEGLSASEISQWCSE